MQRWQLAVKDGEAAVVVEADVGVFMAAVGVRDRGKHKAQHVAVQTRQDRTEVNGLTPGQRGDDSQHSLLATGQRDKGVVVDGGRVEPPRARLVIRLDPRMTRVREPALARPHQQFDCCL